MHSKHTILIGKAVKRAARLRGGGSALPGLVVEKLDPGFVGDQLSKLPMGVVVVSGTNGKTTTTKIVSQLLSAAGLKVFTNKTGSNFVRGIAAALLDELGPDGRLPHDIAVLELDEAHAVQFVKRAPVHHLLLLNVMRDQLDRFGEIDYTAQLLTQVAEHASKAVILNRDDPRISAIASSVKPGVAVQYFGAAPSLQDVFVNDDKLYQSESEMPLPPSHPAAADVELESFEGQNATFKIDGRTYPATMQLSGVYNFLNAAGALALCRSVLSQNPAAETSGKTFSSEQLVKALTKVHAAFGRGETLHIGSTELELVLVKNPAGFRLALASFDPKDTAIMIAINDQYADGRDMSWLWDVDFSSLRAGVDDVSGIRAYDMALRLRYDNVPVRHIEPELNTALDHFLNQPANPSRKRIFCTYTAMLQLRRLLRKYTKLEIMG